MKVDKETALQHLEEIIRIEERSFTDPWSLDMFDDLISSSFYVNQFMFFNESDEVIAYLFMTIIEYEAEIYNVAVSPDYRNEGLGSKILDEAIDFAMKSKVSEIYLEVRESNIPAIMLYTKKGFEIVGKRKNYYESPKEDAFLMKLSMEIK